MKARGPAAEHLSRKSRAEKANSSPKETRLFQCPNYGYVKSFQRFSSPQRYPDVGKHKYVLERETQSNAVICHQTCPRQCCPRQCWSRKPASSRNRYLSYLRMSSIPRLKARGSNHQLYKGKGLNKVWSSASSVSIWESSVAKKSMLVMCLNL